jgi:RimJ/RimL family protein N-acetyltransferase
MGMTLWHTFRDKHRISGSIVDLKLESHHMKTEYHPYDSYDFGIYIHGTRTRVGYCDLRIGMSEELYYAGNVGYRINEAYRGHGYAAEACLLLFPLAHERYGMKELIITCSPENAPSNATLRRLGCQYVTTVPVPAWHWLYQRGETCKNIYRYSFDVKDD